MDRRRFASGVRVRGPLCSRCCDRRSHAEPAAQPAAAFGTDGGTSENLGAIALIRRGVSMWSSSTRNTTRKLRYGAYVNLRDGSAAMARYWTFPRLKLRTRRPQPHGGHVAAPRGRPQPCRRRNCGDKPNFYYLKMRISPGVEAQLRDMTLLAMREAADGGSDWPAVWRRRLPRRRSAAAVSRSLFVYHVAATATTSTREAPSASLAPAGVLSRPVPPLPYARPELLYRSGPCLLGLGVLEGEALAATLAAREVA
jgi:hypothetical protein